jgi:inosose dehydratase
MVCLFHSGPWTDPTKSQALIADGRRWAEALERMGGEVLMLVPGGRRAAPDYTREEFAIMADAMNETGRQAQRIGIVTAMHPHWGTVAETQEEIELLLSLLDPAVVGFAPDSGQIAKGGADPVPLFRKYADRIQHVHLKDISPEWEEMKRAGVTLRSPEGYAELGEGLIDFPAIFEIVREAGFSGWLMAELDETKRTARESAEISMHYLKGHLL